MKLVIGKGERAIRPVKPGSIYPLHMALKVILELALVFLPVLSLSTGPSAPAGWASVRISRRGPQGVRLVRSCWGKRRRYWILEWRLGGGRRLQWTGRR